MRTVSDYAQRLGLSFMPCGMRSDGQELKIFDPVVGLDSIFVVNNISFGDWSVTDLPDDSMLQKRTPSLATIDSDCQIAT